MYSTQYTNALALRVPGDHGCVCPSSSKPARVFSFAGHGSHCVWRRKNKRLIFVRRDRSKWMRTRPFEDPSNGLGGGLSKRQGLGTYANFCRVLAVRPQRVLLPSSPASVLAVPTALRRNRSRSRQSRWDCAVMRLSKSKYL